MINMLEASKVLAKHLSDDDLVVAGLGNPKFTMFEAKDRPRNFYVWNAMGLTASIGLGMATAAPDKRVVVLQGDGCLLLGLSSLATEAWKAPKKFVHIVWDNRMYELTGKQPTATSGPTDLAKMAEGAGFTKVERVETIAAFEAAVKRAFNEDGPWFIHCLVDDKREGKAPPKSPTGITHRFLQSMGLR